MNNKLIIWILVILVVVVAIVMLTKGDDGGAPVTGEGESVSIDIDEQNNSGQDGEVTLTQVGDQVRVTIAMDAAVSTSTVAGTIISQPAHIHAGMCPTPGAVVFPLIDVIGGHSETMIDGTLDQIKALMPLAVNIHKSATEISTYVACGNLAF